MTTLHGIVLAAGNGRRLKGIVPTGLKPLIVVNGEPLITRIVDQAIEVSDLVTVVVSPANAAPIVELVGTGVHYVVQPEPRGPGDALRRGLVTSGNVSRSLVLMGDNWLEDGVVQTVVDSRADVVIGVRDIGVIYPDVARRFTRVKVNPSGVLVSEEGHVLGWAGPWTVWCGPLVVPTVMMKEALDNAVWTAEKEEELKIGPYLGDVDLTGVTALIPVEAKDIGIPEELV